jgi:hypothetical protein
MLNPLLWYLLFVAESHVHVLTANRARMINVQMFAVRRASCVRAARGGSVTRLSYPNLHDRSQMADPKWLEFNATDPEIFRPSVLPLPHDSHPSKVARCSEAYLPPPRHRFTSTTGASQPLIG